MMYGFQLLSLLLTFLLIIVYYNKKDSFTKGNIIYRGILLNTYIIQLFASFTYIAIENKSMNEIISKLYFLLVLLWFALYGLYYLIILIKNNLKDNKSKLDKVINNTTICYGITTIIGGLLILFTQVPLINNYFDYTNNIVYYFIGIYLIIELLSLIFSYKQLTKDKFINLLVIILIQGSSYLLQGRSPEIPFLIIGMIISVYYNYFMLENTDKELLRNITLERDYAKRQNIDKSAFLKVLSHEIRTPLNTIDGMSQIIMDSNNLEDIKNDIKDIRIASRDLIDVINGMIDLSILESGNLEILAENYNIYDTIEDIKNITESKMRDKNVIFKLDIDNDIPEILSGDSKRFSQVILNLLTNAIKYTDKGTITLKIDSVKSSTKCRLKITVTDTGKGIKKEDLNTIFEKNHKKEGTSLGLAVSKYLLELMNGNIEIESTYGTGTKVTVTLDQKIVSDNNEEKITRKRVLKPFKASDKRILLVDDNKLNLKVATKLLQPYDIEIVEANSGKECLDILEKDTKFDLILMDDLMPEMSGTECLDILKKIERVDGYYIPVVVLTANAISGMKEKYLNSGFEDYLSKPIDKYELDRILKKYLKK